MNTQNIKERIVDLLNSQIIEIPTVDAEQFSEVDLPFIGVTMNTERVSNALPKAYRGTVEVKLRAHSGDALTVSQINAITNELEAILTDDFGSSINDGLSNIFVDYFATNGGIPQWESNSLECSFDCDIVFQSI
jgi:hypothetical protein